MVTHLEPDIMKCDAKWALRSITMKKASGFDGIPAELFQILKDDSVKVLHSICQQILKLSSGHRTGKYVFTPISKKDNAENIQTTKRWHLFHMPVGLCSKFFNLVFSSM